LLIIKIKTKVEYCFNVSILKQYSRSNEEHVIALQTLKKELVDNYAVYHERVTLLVQLTVFDIQETRVNFKAKIIKPLNKAHAETSILYKHMITKDEISFSASYLIRDSEEDGPLLKNNKVGRFYCPFTLWIDPELALFVLNNEDAITKQIPAYILWSKDWKLINMTE
jgi:hypothetical protein